MSSDKSTNEIPNQSTNAVPMDEDVLDGSFGNSTSEAPDQSTSEAPDQSADAAPMEGVVTEQPVVQEVYPRVSLTDAMRRGVFVSREDAQALEDDDMAQAEALNRKSAKTVDGNKVIKGRQKRRYTDDQLVQFIRLIISCVPVKAAASKSGIYISTAYRYRKLYNTHGFIPERLPRGPKKSTVFTIEHQRSVIEFIEDKATCTLAQMQDHLISKFPGWEMSRSSFYRYLRGECRMTLKKVNKLNNYRLSEDTILKRQEVITRWLLDEDMDYQKNCVFLDESGFNLHITRLLGWSTKGTRCEVSVPSGAGGNITMIGAIYHGGLLDFKILLPSRETILGKRKVDSNSDEPAEDVEISEFKGTRTEDYLAFLESVMDQLEQRNLKNFYLVQDNSPIHRNNILMEAVEKRGHKLVNLPPYSPFLNPIEEYWSKLKYCVKRSNFDTEEDLSKRIVEATKQMSPSDYHGWIRHSLYFFKNCIDKDPKL